MVEEIDVIDFLKDHGGQATLNEIALGLGIPKYGPNSAYAVLQSLKSKGMVDRKGEMWVLVAAEAKKPSEAAKPTVEAAPKPEVEVATAAPSKDVETIVQAMAKTLALSLIHI